MGSLSERIGLGRLLRGAILLALLSPAAFASVIGAVSRARAMYCVAVRAPDRRLSESRRLDEVARLLARGESLQEAERRAGYLAAGSLWIQLSGVRTDAAVEQMMRRQFCAQLASPGLRQIGAYRRGGEVWIAIAEPFSTPPAADAATARRLVLELTNRARERWRRCGATLFPPAPPLSLAPALTRAARAHSRDMAAHGVLSHSGSDGSDPGERASRAGYRWRMVGENIASGLGTPQRVVAGWLASPHHCANIMTAGFRQMGVAFAVNPASDAIIYWTEDFGAPRQ